MDAIADVLLGILRHYSEKLFYRTHPSDCLCNSLNFSFCGVVILADAGNFAWVMH